MRILGDENLPRVLVDALGSAGHDVLWIRSACPGIADDAVLRLAIDESRILLTFDKDFGEQALRRTPPGSAGVILLRVPVDPEGRFAELIVKTLGSHQPRFWLGRFAVIEPGRIRIRPPPSA